MTNETLEVEINADTFTDLGDCEDSANAGGNEIVENVAGLPLIADEIKSILEKSNHKNVTPDFKINITVKDGYMNDLKVNMQHKMPRE